MWPSGTVNFIHCLLNLHNPNLIFPNENNEKQKQTTIHRATLMSTVWCFTDASLLRYVGLSNADERTVSEDYSSHTARPNKRSNDTAKRAKRRSHHSQSPSHYLLQTNQRESPPRDQTSMYHVSFKLYYYFFGLFASFLELLNVCILTTLFLSISLKFIHFCELLLSKLNLKSNFYSKTG